MPDQDDIRFYFDMYGPFEITRKDGHIGSGLADTWDLVCEACPGQGHDEKELETAIGC